MLSSLLHDGLHAHPPVFSFSGQHVNGKGQPIICWAHLRIEDSLQVLQPLVDCIWTSLPVELHGMVFQEVFHAPLLDWWSWLWAKHRGSRPILLQLAKCLLVLLMGILSNYPSSLHMLHHKLLLLKRHCLSLHRCFVLLHHRSALLRHSSYHCKTRRI